MGRTSKPHKGDYCAVMYGCIVMGIDIQFVNCYSDLENLVLKILAL